MTLLIVPLFITGIAIANFQAANAGEPISPLETEKFYTETDKDFENNFFGTLLPIKDDGTQTVSAVIHPKKGTISSYNPGQYYAWTKVTAFEDLDSIRILENDIDCTASGVLNPSISKMNPPRIPGGAIVAEMCDDETEDLTSELAKSGALFIRPDGLVEVTVNDIDAGCMVFLGIKYSPGLKDEIATRVPAENRSCENWELVCGEVANGVTATNLVTPQNDNGVNFDCEGFFADAHRVLEVIGLPEPPVPCTECLEIAGQVASLCLDEGGSFEDCFSEAEPILSECALVCEGTAEEKTDTCSSAGVVKNNVCLLSGEDSGVCRDEAEAFFFECSGEEELPPVPCTECEVLPLLFILSCLDEGGSFEDCFSKVEPILSECALVCEGTAEEKTDTCNTATSLKNNVCLLSGEDFGVCRDEAEAFVFECSGEELPPVPCTECEVLPLLFILSCLDEGGSFEDCFSKVEPILSGCALVCEGTP